MPMSPWLNAKKLMVENRGGETPTKTSVLFYQITHHERKILELICVMATRIAMAC